MKLFRRSIEKRKGESEGGRKAVRTTLGVFVVLGILVFSAAVVAQSPFITPDVANNHSINESTAEASTEVEANGSSLPPEDINTSENDDNVTESNRTVINKSTLPPEDINTSENGDNVAEFTRTFIILGGSKGDSWYFKSNYPNYAPSGMPDFDQKQDNWKNPIALQWSFCGPTAVANCFWWFDSKYANHSGTPGDGADAFPLVQNYNAPVPVWGSDDHDPSNVDDPATPWPIGNELVEQLAWCMDTDGVRTGSPLSGTDVHVMEQCIANWLNATGLNHTLYEHTVKMPEFEYIVEEVYRSQDVILLLGFWEWQSDHWVRIGGHYVTVAGVNATPPGSYPLLGTIAISDPFFDNAEAGGPGNVPVPHGYPHGPTVHNDAQYVSHDYYWVWHVPNPGEPPEMSPGGFWELVEYAGYPQDWVWSFAGLNCPEEFVSMQGEWLGGPIKTEIEYAVLVSPLPPTPFFIRGWVNCNTGDPINNPNVTVTNLNTSEVFIAETAASSNYYQVLTSSQNVRTGDVLNFNASNNGNSTEFNYTVTHADMCAGGFEQNITIECGQQQGICGDVDGSEMVDMADYFLLVDYIAEIPGRTLESEWAGDVDCSDKVDMADYFLLVDYIAEIPGRDLDCC